MSTMLCKNKNKFKYKNLPSTWFYTLLLLLQNNVPGTWHCEKIRVGATFKIAKIIIGITVMHTIAGSLNVTALDMAGSTLSNRCHSFPDVDTWQIRYIQTN